MTTPAISQKGVKFIVGFNGNLYEGFQMDDATETPTGDLEYIPDDNANDATQMASNEGEQIVLNGVILRATESEIADLRAMKKLDDITINSKACFVMECQLTLERTEAKGSITAQVIPGITEAEVV